MQIPSLPNHPTRDKYIYEGNTSLWNVEQHRLITFYSPAAARHICCKDKKKVKEGTTFHVHYWLKEAMQAVGVAEFLEKDIGCTRDDIPTYFRSMYQKAIEPALLAPEPNVDESDMFRGLHKSMCIDVVYEYRQHVLALLARTDITSNGAAYMKDYLQSLEKFASTLPILLEREESEGIEIELWNEGGINMTYTEVFPTNDTEAMSARLLEFEGQNES